MGSEPLKFRGAPNIFLTKYQLPVFLCLVFAEKIVLLLVNQRKISQSKLALRSWKISKQNLDKKIFCDPPPNSGGLDATNELTNMGCRIFKGGIEIR